MSTRLVNMPIPFTFQFNVLASGTPEQLTVKKRGATIAFNDNGAAADTITDSANEFITAGFEVGDQIVVSGASNSGNNSTFEVTAVVAGEITIAARHSLTTEAAGATVKIVTNKTVPDGISVTVYAKFANTGIITLGYSSATALNTGTGYFSLRNNSSVSLQINSIGQLWLDAAVSGEGVEVIYEKNIT